MQNQAMFTFRVLFVLLSLQNLVFAGIWSSFHDGEVIIYVMPRETKPEFYLVEEFRVCSAFIYNPTTLLISDKSNEYLKEKLQTSDPMTMLLFKDGTTKPVYFSVAERSISNNNVYKVTVNGEPMTQEPATLPPAIVEDVKFGYVNAQATSFIFFSKKWKSVTTVEEGDKHDIKVDISPFSNVELDKVTALADDDYIIAIRREVNNGKIIFTKVWEGMH